MKRFWDPVLGIAPRSYNRLLGVVRRLFDWLVVQGIVPGSPLKIQARRQTAKCPPFIFNRSQARQLLDAAAQLPDTSRSTQRGETYELAFLLMYGLGLRVGEVARLRSCDVDFDRHLLVIRQTKFAKSRLVPFGPRIEERIRTYLSHREQYATLSGTRRRRPFHGRDSITLFPVLVVLPLGLDQRD